MTAPATGAAAGAGLAGAADLAGLVGARICHDLVSPLGAIGNGLELLRMTDGAAGPELALIGESAALATARMRLFRLAFGRSQPGALVGRAEIGGMLDGLAPAARALVAWNAPGALPRDEVRLALLLLMCLETALPYGGGVTFARTAAGAGPEGWAIRAEAARMAVDAGLWDIARGRAAPTGVAPRHVQFALVPPALAALGRKLVLIPGDGVLELRA